MGVRTRIDETCLFHCNDECTTTGGTCVVAYWYLRAYIYFKTHESILASSTYLRAVAPEGGVLDQTGTGMCSFLMTMSTLSATSKLHEARVRIGTRGLPSEDTHKAIRW